MTTGKFIVLEGIDGSGTTTQAVALAQYLFQKDKQNIVLLTREPTKLSPYGQKLRRQLSGELLPDEQPLTSPEEWAGLFIDDRRWHVSQCIHPMLREGIQVVSDRYKLSTIAYQSAQGLDMDGLIQRHEGLVVPDLTLLIDVPVEVAMERLRKDRSGREYFEKKDLQERIRNNYLLAVRKLDSERIRIINGTLAIDEVTRAIQHEVDYLY